MFVCFLPVVVVFQFTKRLLLFFLHVLAHLPAGLLLHLLVLPHFFGVLVLPDRHRGSVVKTLGLTKEKQPGHNPATLRRTEAGEEGSNVLFRCTLVMISGLVGFVHI